MNYVLADRRKALGHGFSAATHTEVKGMMVLTEKELRYSPKMTGTPAERLAAVGGRTVTLKEIRNIEHQ